ncbi:J domain-containing protein [Pontibacter sp. 13R65]|uniref:J domain-containing protein n=1 Tax=Pontibacter sp. 13R65 TaxID=3127458 RepID=UPI00301E0237
MANKIQEASAQLVPQMQEESGNLTLLQRQFNQMMKRVNALKAEQQQRKNTMAILKARVQKELVPLENETIDLKVAIVKQLDQAYHESFLHKKEQEQLALFISDMAFSLVEKYGKEELIELHDRYAPKTYAEAALEAEANQMAQNMFKGAFGEEKEAEALDDVERTKAKRNQRPLEGQQDTRQNKSGAKKKTKTQLEKEEAMKVEVSNLSKASRRLYTELVKQLHPDKEQDETKRAWKEEAIKEVTLAYGNNDFFGLLRLQMQFLGNRSKAAEEEREIQLKYYVKLLSDQVQELEKDAAQHALGPEANLLYQFGGSPKAVEKTIRREKKVLRDTIQQLQSELKLFTNPEVVKQFVKQLKFR